MVTEAEPEVRGPGAVAAEERSYLTHCDTWFTPSSLLSVALFAPLIKRFRKKHRKEAEVLRGSFPSLHTDGRDRENPLI